MSKNEVKILREMTKAFKRCAASAGDVGITTSQLAVLVSKALFLSERSGDIVGNALKTVFVRLSREDILNSLGKAGLDIFDQYGFPLSIWDILQKISNSDFGRSLKMVELVGGVNQFSIIKTLFEKI